MNALKDEDAVIEVATPFPDEPTTEGVTVETLVNNNHQSSGDDRFEFFDAVHDVEDDPSENVKGVNDDMNDGTFMKAREIHANIVLKRSVQLRNKNLLPLTSKSYFICSKKTKTREIALKEKISFCSMDKLVLEKRLCFCI
jgi:hypothetical protein